MLYTIHNTLYTIRYTLLTTHYTLYNIQREKNLGSRVALIPRKFAAVRKVVKKHAKNK